MNPTNNRARWIALGLSAFLLALAPTATAGPKACNDGIDNDGDGLIDYPDDPGCSSRNDNNEYNEPPAPPPPPPACSDGVDNDGDGMVDYPADPGCTSASDNDEYNAPPPPPSAPACSDGIDNDGDGYVDYPQDPGCMHASDTSERGTTQCDDGIDNDGDGRVDFPSDPQCESPRDTNEGDVGGTGLPAPPMPPAGLPYTPFCGISMCTKPNPGWISYPGALVGWGAAVAGWVENRLPER